MTKKDGDRLREMKAELRRMSVEYADGSITERFLFEMGTRLNLFLAGREREACEGLLNDEALASRRVGA